MTVLVQEDVVKFQVPVDYSVGVEIEKADGNLSSVKSITEKQNKNVRSIEGESIVKQVRLE